MKVYSELNAIIQKKNRFKLHFILSCFYKFFPEE